MLDTEFTQGIYTFLFYPGCITFFMYKLSLMYFSDFLCWQISHDISAYQFLIWAYKPDDSTSLAQKLVKSWETGSWTFKS